ncbi:hypothetical protein BaRGS_00033654 [Batillaria attramentaria]|uniref:Uncharacterized protein n=1 Tax=Batillaria attramentaria TaxID=370345 RepID=A0ABD0JJC4_9CAEN
MEAEPESVNGYTHTAYLPTHFCNQSGESCWSDMAAGAGAGKVSAQSRKQLPDDFLMARVTGGRAEVTWITWPSTPQYPGNRDI